MASIFAQNPATCPAASVVGHTVGHTRILCEPLTGPAYLVSHGGEAFPELVIVLQGYGWKGVSSFIGSEVSRGSTFNTVPDAPFKSFELTLPEGPYSALAANGNLCKSKLVMPTEFVAQNGAEIKQTTRIKVAGCPKKKTTKAKEGG